MPIPTASPPPPSGPDRLRGRLMAASLGQLLDRVPGSREVLLHLAALERSLVLEGLQAIDRASERTLTRLCAQLGSLPLPEHDPPLHDLLDRVMAALEARRAAEHDVPFDIERTMVIQEISHSAFMDATREDAPTVFEPRV